MFLPLSFLKYRTHSNASDALCDHVRSVSPSGYSSDATGSEA